ncbi:MAG: lasso peptide biosynthesis B2 protein [Sphingobacterium sp.]
MRYTLNEHIYIANYHDTAVLLDTNQDRFHLLESVTAQEINDVFCGKESEKINHLRQVLSNANLIRNSTSDPPVIQSFESNCFFEQRGVNKQYGNKINYLVVALAAFFILCSYAGIKLLGYRVINKLPGSRSTRSPKCELAKAKMLSDHTKLAFVLLGEPGKCLVEAIALYLILSLWGCTAVLCVGVRTRPLLSHAWVEVQNKVLNDDDNLRTKLAIILEKS